MPSTEDLRGTAQQQRLVGRGERLARVPVHHERALFDLWNAVNVYGNVPSKFPPPRESTIADQDFTPKEMRLNS